MADILVEAVAAFQKVYSSPPVAYGKAPGRVEVLGNHTDYNDGFILAAAIDRNIVVVGRGTDSPLARVHSLTFDAGFEFSVDKLERGDAQFWGNYVMGVVWQLKKIGVQVGGFDAVITGDVPLGSGLSSSAALELATATFLREIIGFSIDPIDLALNCQAAENQFVGVNCGILDQFASMMGKKNRLVFLDCRELKDYNYYPLGEGFELVIADTRAPHALIDGGYNRLRESCFRAAQVCAEKFPGRQITHLRDVNLADLEAARPGMSDEDFRHARHIVTDNDRVKRGAAALAAGDAVSMGRLMRESHASSRDDFGNSSRELDIMVEKAIDLPGCYGARLNGGGFGGATINLVDSAAAAGFAKQLEERYHAATGIKPEIHLFQAGDGAGGGKL
ncbi:MAG: galactokinase [Planctomycetota bacterium]|jgi:galactokinase|nr:galactokinase [Planctomycetota bacterium]